MQNTLAREPVRAFCVFVYKVEDEVNEPILVKIYHVPGTRSVRVIWLCNELNISLEIETIPTFDAAFKASPDWRAKSPTGKVPVLEIDGITMYESCAMLQFILEKHDPQGLVPKAGTRDSAEYHKWSWFAEATFARPLGDMAQHTSIKPEAERIPEVVVESRERALLCVEAVDAHMKNREYLVDCGFTAADIVMGYSMMLARRFSVLEDHHEHGSAYFDRLLARPAFQAALQA